MLEVSKLAFRRAVISQGGPAGVDRIPKNGLNFGNQPLGARGRLTSARRQGGRLAARRQSRAIERLADIDVPEPGNDTLIEQCCFQAGLLALAATRQIAGRQGVAKGLDPEPGDQFVLLETVGRRQSHETEPPHVIVGDRRPVAHGENNMVVARIVAGVVQKLTRLQGICSRTQDPEPAAHAKMHDQHLAAFEMSQKIFRPPRQRVYALTGKPLHEPVRKGKPQIRPPLLDMLEMRADKHVFKAAAHGLDFR